MAEYFELVTADNVTLANAQTKAVYLDKKVAIQALFTEVQLAAAQHSIDSRYCRFLELDNKIAVDYGAWGDFIGLTNVTIADLDA